MTTSAFSRNRASRYLTPQARFFNISFDSISESALVQYIVAQAKLGFGGDVITINLDHLRRLTLDAEFRQTVQKAKVRIADGMPIIWASRLQGKPLPERVTGSNLIYSLTEAAADNDLSIFFLGGADDTAQRTADILKAKYPKLQVAGVYAPPFGFEHQLREIEHICGLLETIQPNIVYVALGSPKTERLFAHISPVVEQAWWLGVGAGFNFVTGEKLRAPQWMQRFGLEWAHRLWLEPIRLFDRYIVKGLPFFWRLMMHALVSRFRHNG